jgi:hypothetical protein
VGEPEEPSRGLPHDGFGDLGIGVGAVAARKQALLTEEALAAADGERHHDPITDREGRDAAAHRDHLAHVLVAEDITLLHGGLKAVEQMQVRSADGGRGDLDDDVARILNGRIGDGVDANIAGRVPTKCFHVVAPVWGDGRRFR